MSVYTLKSVSVIIIHCVTYQIKPYAGIIKETEAVNENKMRMCMTWRVWCGRTARTRETFFMYIVYATILSKIGIFMEGFFIWKKKKMAQIRKLHHWKPNTGIYSIVWKISVSSTLKYVQVVMLKSSENVTFYYLKYGNLLACVLHFIWMNT